MTMSVGERIAEFGVELLDPPDPMTKGFARKVFPDGRSADLVPMIYNTRLVVSAHVGDETWIDAWCFEHPHAALLSLMQWDGEGDVPDGWTKHIGSGRCRPHGDPALEHIDQ